MPNFTTATVSKGFKYFFNFETYSMHSQFLYVDGALSSFNALYRLLRLFSQANI